MRTTESRIDRGENLFSGRPEGQVTLGDLIDLHLADLKKARKVPGRSKKYTLDSLKVRPVDMKTSLLAAPVQICLMPF